MGDTEVLDITEVIAFLDRVRDIFPEYEGEFTPTIDRLCEIKKLAFDID